MVVNSDTIQITKNEPNGVPVKHIQNGQRESVQAEESQPMSKVSSAMQSAPKLPKFGTKEEEREWVKFRLAQGVCVG